MKVLQKKGMYGMSFLMGYLEMTRNYQISKVSRVLSKGKLTRESWGAEAGRSSCLPALQPERNPSSCHDNKRGVNEMENKDPP